MGAGLILGVVFGLLLAYANGANDNFKGVATLFGSGAVSYRPALFWATGATALGSVAAVFLANGMLEAFRGKGLVPAEVAATTSFGLSVALGAGVTVFLATRFGLPISTTHSLIGALVGAGYFAAEGGIYFEKLGSKFLLPLLVSPVLAILATMAIYPLLRGVRRRLGIERETCFCVGSEIVAALPEGAYSRDGAEAGIELPGLSIGTEVECRERYNGSFGGITAETAVNRAHFISSGLVSFARGLNDTPKIAALLLVGGAVEPAFAIAAVAVLIASGGLLSARKVAETMSLRVTDMNQGQGLTANVVTSFLVIVASRWGLPVSTTHVSCGSLFGIGAVTRQAHWKTVAEIVGAWIVTLPLAAVVAATAYGILSWSF